MSKLALSLLFVAGCGVEYIGVDIVPAHDGPLAVGSDESFAVLQDTSSQFGDPDVIIPDHITVTIADEGIARLVTIDRAKGTFVLHGVAPGTTRVTATGNGGMPGDRDITVR